MSEQLFIEMLEASERIAQLEAENKALREALELEGVETIDDAREIAYDALKEFNND